MYLLLLGFGCLAGLTTVLFGFGGGFVVVPVLYATLIATHGIGSPIGAAAMHIAVATSAGVMICGAAMATLRHHRAGTVAWEQVRPLIGYIAIGAVFGAAAALSLSGGWVRWAFIVYLGGTMLDCLLRPGFMGQAGRIRPMSGPATAAAGVAIGAIAALLGVGGSVMTVPLMRRRGASMTAATAMANPLSLPMAVAGTAAYVAFSWGAPSLGPWFAGPVDLRAFPALVVGSWLGIRLASPWIGLIPDRVHARIYLLLLAGVLVVMLSV